MENAQLKHIVHLEKYIAMNVYHVRGCFSCLRVSKIEGDVRIGHPSTSKMENFFNILGFVWILQGQAIIPHYYFEVHFQLREKIQENSHIVTEQFTGVSS